MITNLDIRVARLTVRCATRLGRRLTPHELDRINSAYRQVDLLATRAMWRRNGRALLVRSLGRGGRFLAP